MLNQCRRGIQTCRRGRAAPSVVAQAGAARSSRRRSASAGSPRRRCDLPGNSRHAAGTRRSPAPCLRFKRRVSTVSLLGTCVKQHVIKKTRVGVRLV